MKTLLHRLKLWLFPETPPTTVPKMTHRAEDVPAMVRRSHFKSMEDESP